jgi:mannobiose 2-epimerase
MSHLTALIVLLVVLLLLQVTDTARAQAPASTQPSPETYRRLAAEAEQQLHTQVLDKWYPACIDKEHGGFHSHFARDWSPQRSQGKFIVFQSRQTWVAAEVSKRRPELRETYLPYARHGLQFLLDVMWDKENGGFYWMTDDQGVPSDGGAKHLYGLAFGVYAAANAFDATQDPRALDLAKRAFTWIEQHAHDAEYGGYFEHLARDGTVLDERSAAGGTSVMGPVGYKSMNAHIHMLEAYAQLYHVWKDEQLRKRLLELHEIVRDKIANRPGSLNVYLTRDWRGVPDHVSLGHDIETAYLLDESAKALGMEDDEPTQHMGRLLVDHTIDYGWDHQHGGIYTKGAAFEQAWDRHKDWWGQFESLNALLLMHERYGAETDRYWRYFLQQWETIRRDLTDHQFGGHYSTINPDGSFEETKGQNWKAAYHESRALLEVADRLNHMADAMEKRPSR